MKKKINKLDKSRRLIKLSPDSESYQVSYKRNKLTGKPDIYQEVGMDLRSVQDAADMIIDIDEFFDNHLPNQKRDQLGITTMWSMGTLSENRIS